MKRYRVPSKFYPQCFTYHSPSFQVLNKLLGKSETISIYILTQSNRKERIWIFTHIPCLFAFCFWLVFACSTAPAAEDDLPPKPVQNQHKNQPKSTGKPLGVI